ncbi:hypothetical protein LZ30DRAFT_120919 [Colletotrichum cereale]|nr:hypothetical protein LZ30DRAFT_120919 [Colletotrichum cereale]
MQSPDASARAWANQSLGCARFALANHFLGALAGGHTHTHTHTHTLAKPGAQVENSEQGNRPKLRFCLGGFAGPAPPRACANEDMSCHREFPRQKPVSRNGSRSLAIFFFHFAFFSQSVYLLLLVYVVCLPSPAPSPPLLPENLHSPSRHLIPGQGGIRCHPA